MAAAVRVEIWRTKAGDFMLLEELSVSEAFTLTTIGERVVETREVDTSAEGVQWFTQWSRDRIPGATVRKVSSKELQEKMVEALVPTKGEESS